MFDNIPMDALLSVLMKNQNNIDKVVKYIQLRGNNAVIAQYKYSDMRPLQEFLRTFEKLITAASQNKEYISLIDRILNKSVIEGTLEIIQKANSSSKKEVYNLFKNEEVVVKAMNSHLIPDIIKIITANSPELIYSQYAFPKIGSILIMLIFAFKKESTLVKNSYICLYKILANLFTLREHIDIKELVNILSEHQLFKSLFTNLPKTIRIMKDSISVDQKLVFELLFLFLNLQQQVGIKKDLSGYPAYLPEVETSKRILSERRLFEYASYKSLLKSLPEEDKEVQKVETCHKQFKAPFVSKHTFGNDTVKIKFFEENNIDPMNSLNITKDPEGKEVILKLSSDDLKSNELSFFNYVYQDQSHRNALTVQSSTFYMHYPCPSTKVVAFGNKEHYMLGEDSRRGVTGAPICIPQLNTPIKAFRQRTHYTFALTEDGTLYRCGSKSDWRDQYHKMEVYGGDLPDDTIIDIRTGCKVYLLTDSQKIYIGKNDTEGVPRSRRKWEFYYSQRPNESEEVILNWEAGWRNVVYTTTNGKAYVKEFPLSNDENETDWRQLVFGEGKIPIQPSCGFMEESRSIIMLLKNEDRLELWSQGKHKGSLLGQGFNIHQSDNFVPLEYDRQQIQFTKVDVRIDFALALTDKGELYGWGENTSNQLGMKKDEEHKVPSSDKYVIHKPTEIIFFKDYYVHDFSVGNAHALIKASPRNNMNTTKLFATGVFKGIDGVEKDENGIYHLSQFDDANYSWIQ